MRRTNRITALALAIAALAAPAAADAAIAAGSILGDFSTDTRGAASYTIDLPVPPGTGGIEPSLALAYNSSAGNGLLGLGWSLAGMSSIARCPPVFAADGYRAPVTYTMRDRLCLDGVQLVAVSGAYWGPGTVYHTELESWMKVTARDDGSFVAQSPEGKTVVYGGDAQSRIYAPLAGATRVWAMSSVADRFGNTMTYSYANNPGDSGQYYPTAIDYTSNAAAPIRFSRRVTFTYDYDRTDVVTQYVGGSPVRLSARLTGIDTWLVNPSPTPVSRFTLGYRYSASTSRLLLVSIRQCEPGGDCYPETLFTPQEGSNTLRSAQQIGQMTFGTTDNVKFQWGSFRGNGRRDLLVYNDGAPNNVWVATMSADGTLDPTPLDLGSNPCAGNAYQWQDFDGDGKVDLLCTPNTGDLRHWVRLSTGSGLAAPIVFGSLQCLNGDFTWADFNGDGRPDLVCDAQDARYVRLSSGNGLQPQIPLGSFVLANAASTWADFNGDGMADLLVDQSAAPFGHWVLISTGSGLQSPVALGPLGDAGSSFSWVDLNGDGLADLVADQNVAPFQHWVRYSTGKGLTANPVLLGQFPPAGPGDGKPLDYRWVDFNGDGLADLVCCDSLAATTGRFVLLSNGARLGAATPIGNFTRPNATYSWLDLTGDGMVDLAIAPGSNQAQAFAQQHQGPFPDLVTQIRNGVGGQTRIAYEPMTSPGMYAANPDFRFSYPLREQVSPIYVVKRKNSNDGRLNLYTYDYTYRYSGSVTDLSGRGWLGFARIDATDVQTTVVRRTDYAQPFPRTGMVTGTQTLTSANLQLDAKSYAYATTVSFPGVYSVLRQSETLTYFDGGNRYSTGQAFTYDAYGSVVLTRFRGDLGNDRDDYAICAAYLNRTDGGDWLIGFPVQRVTAKACTVGADGACNCTGPLAKTAYGYSRSGPLAVTSVGSWVDTDDSWITITYGHDAYGNATSIASPVIGATAIAFDPDYATFETKRTNALGQATASAFAPQFGVQLATTDPNGVTRTQTLDGFGRPTAIRVPNPASGAPQTVREIRRVLKGDISAGGELYTETRSLNGWDASGDEAWRWTREYLDGLGRTYLTRAGAGTDETNTIDKAKEFDNEAQVKMESLAYYKGSAPPWVGYSYDLMGRVERTRYANGSVTTFARAIVPDPATPGAMVNRVVSTSAAGTPSARDITRYVDPQGNLVRSVYADRAEVNFAYDVLNRAVKLSLPNGAVSDVTYDSLDRQVRVSSADSGTTAFLYDRRGHLARQTDGAGQSTSYEYDVLGRVTLKTLSTGQSVTYAYDEPGHGAGIGRLTTTTVRDGPAVTSTTSYTYDPLGRISRKQVGVGASSWTEEMAYDPSGRITSTTYPDRTVSTSTYLPNGFLASLAYGAAGSPPLQTVTYSNYTALGKPQDIRYASGRTTLYSAAASYFDDGRLRSQSFSSASARLADYTYSWTPLRQIDTITDALSGKPAWRYKYGPQGYLASAQGPLAPLSFTYDYDPAGNLTAANDLKLAYESQRFVSGTSARGPLAAEYTGAGQLRKLAEGTDTRTYGYDAMGRLRRFDAASGSTRFDYDADGLRLSKVEPGATTVYPFGDVDVTTLADGRSLLTKTIAGPFGAAIAVTTGAGPAGEPKAGELQPGPNGWGVPAAGTYFYLRSFDGSTALVGDANGQVVTVLGYDPYGNIQTATSSGLDETRSKFLGQEFDHSTGLYSLSRRYLNPRFGRFITPDTRSLGGADYSAAAFNRYAYGGNDPVNNQDPSGGFFLIDDIIEWTIVAAAVAEAAEAAAEVAATVAAVTAGTYIGGAAVNGSLNPGKWKWGSPKTFIGMITGGVFGAFGGDIAEAIAGAVGGGFTGGLVGAAAEAGFENAVYATESNPNPANIAESFFLGAVQGAAFHAIGEGVSAAFASRSNRLMEPDEIEMRDFSAKSPRGPAEGGKPPRIEEGGESCAISLATGTPVATDRGLLPIERITLGDRVLAPDPATGKPALFMVTGTGSRTAASAVRMDFGGTGVTSSPEHPFAVEGRGWVRADEVRAGDRLRRLDGGLVEVESVDLLARPARVHSLQVAHAEHFAASPLGVLAHNITYNMAGCSWGYKGRVETIDVDVDPGDIGTGSATNQATRNFARSMGLPNDDAGHVIARMLGGSGTDVTNIFPQNLSINRGVFARWERVIRRDIQAQNATANLRLQFTYASPFDTRPTGINYEYTLLGVTTSYPGGFGN